MEKVKFEIFKMAKKDLEFITSRLNGDMGSSGTGSGDGCDNTSVHCCFASVVVHTEETESGYALKTPLGLLPIGIDDNLKPKPKGCLAGLFGIK